MGTAIIREIPPGAILKRRFILYFWFVGWDCISLGAHVCFSEPNLEIHLPFGFVRFGWSTGRQPTKWQVGRAIGLAD